MTDSIAFQDVDITRFKPPWDLWGPHPRDGLMFRLHTTQDHLMSPWRALVATLYLQDI